MKIPKEDLVTNILIYDEVPLPKPEPETDLWLYLTIAGVAIAIVLIIIIVIVAVYRNSKQDNPTIIYSRSKPSIESSEAIQAHVSGTERQMTESSIPLFSQTTMAAPRKKSPVGSPRQISKRSRTKSR
jgi:hypothetical protein